MRPHSPDASAASRLGAVIFLHRFGALLNTHLPFHGIVVDGVFEGDAQRGAVFHPASGLDAPTSGEVQTAVRRRLLRSVLQRGLLSADDAQVMAERKHGGGFSVDAQGRTSATVWNVCCAIVSVRPLRWSCGVKSIPSIWSMRA